MKGKARRYLRLPLHVPLGRILDAEFPGQSCAQLETFCKTALQEDRV